jgi:hypothetical protein
MKFPDLREKARFRAKRASELYDPSAAFTQISPHIACR